MKGWAIALIVFLVIAVLLLIATIALAIIVPLVILFMQEEVIGTSSIEEESSSSAPPEMMEMCTSCPVNTIPYFVYGKSPQLIDFGTFSEYETAASDGFFLLNSSRPFFNFCDTSFPSSERYFKFVAANFASFCSEGQTQQFLYDEGIKNNVFPTICKEEFVGYAYGLSSITQAQVESCCDLIPRSQVAGPDVFNYVTTYTNDISEFSSIGIPLTENVNTMPFSFSCTVPPPY